MTDQIVSIPTSESIGSITNNLCTPLSTSHVSYDPAKDEVSTFTRQWSSRLAGSTEAGTASGTNAFGSGTSSSAPLASTGKPGRSRRPSELIVGLKKWIGVVQGIEEGIFTAELSPIDHEGPVFLADFDLELLAPDEEAVEAGDVVYLTTRYVRAAQGYSTATTQVRLRRPGLWTQEEVAEIHESARRDAQRFSQYVD
jgi:hypothetical protein